MTTRLGRWFLCLIGSAYVLSPQPASAQQCADCIMSDQFEIPFFLPANDAEAARFLNQASFGATRADIGAVRSSGPETWIDSQFNVAQTLARPFLEQIAQQRIAGNQTLSQDDRVHRWFDTAVKAPDQLRQKMAYALGQIIVASDQNDFLGNEPVQMAEWNDLMVRNAFGNYKTLLREASFSPMMGRYLTHLRNRKYELNSTSTAQGSNPVQYTITSYTAGNSGNEPDENYAREIMQLFSIGLETRNRDFSLVDVDPGTPGIQDLPTYDQQMIRTLARAFTGLSYDCTNTQVVQGVTIIENCSGPGARNTTPPPTPGCSGVNCRFFNRDTLYFGDPPRAKLPNANDSSLIHPDWYNPMVCYPRYNDNGRDQSRFQLPGQTPTNPVNTTITAGLPIPAGAPDAGKALTLSGTVLQTLTEFQPGVSKETALDCGAANLTTLNDAQRLQCINYCEDNVRSAIDLLFNHPTLPPMVARQLIEHFVTSNPTPAYIDRIAAVFENNGSGVRGDLKAVVKALLLDPEARQPFAGQFGKVREPMLRLVSVWRHFGAVSGGNACRTPNVGNIACWGSANPQNSYFQRPLGAPSVFNFFEPDYQQPGAIEDAGLYSPEFEIINENTTIQTANDLFTRICSGYSSSNNCTAAFVTTLPTDRAYIPPAQLDALPGMACASDLVNGCLGTDDLALIEELNLRMMGGAMSGQVGNPALCSDPGNFGMKSVMHNLLRCGLTGTLGQTGTTAGVDARRRKALYLIHLIAISPEYAHQR